MPLLHSPEMACSRGAAYRFPAPDRILEIWIQVGSRPVCLSRAKSGRPGRAGQSSGTRPSIIDPIPEARRPPSTPKFLAPDDVIPRRTEKTCDLASFPEQLVPAGRISVGFFRGDGIARSLSNGTRRDVVSFNSTLLPLPKNLKPVPVGNRATLPLHRLCP